MAEWLVEEGIGEKRAVLVRDEHIVAARLQWPGGLTPGQVAEAQLVSRQAGSGRGTARLASGEEAMVARLPRSASEGAMIRLEVTRAAMPEAERRKLAQAQPTDRPLRAAPSFVEQLTSAGHKVQTVRRFPIVLGWEELWQEAWEGSVTFNRGVLLFHPTPAMTLIDIDGEDDPLALAKAATAPLAAALRRFDIGGSIGIDFPTVSNRAGRKAIDTMLGEALADWPHERTAMNGFGFVQLVARMERPSILALLTHAPAGAAARQLLRQAEGLEGAGAILLTCPASTAAALRPEWLDKLQRRAGRPVRLEVRPGQLDPGTGHAQLVPHE